MSDREPWAWGVEVDGGTARVIHVYADEARHAAFVEGERCADAGEDDPDPDVVPLYPESDTAKAIASWLEQQMDASTFVRLTWDDVIESIRAGAWRKKEG